MHKLHFAVHAGCKLHGQFNGQGCMGRKVGWHENLALPMFGPVGVGNVENLEVLHNSQCFGEVGLFDADSHPRRYFRICQIDVVEFHRNAFTFQNEFHFLGTFKGVYGQSYETVGCHGVGVLRR